LREIVYKIRLPHTLTRWVGGLGTLLTRRIPIKTNGTVIFLFNPTMDGHGVVIIVNLIRDLGGHPEP